MLMRMRFQDMDARRRTVDHLETAREESVTLLSYASAASSDITQTNTLSQSSRKLIETVNEIVEQIGIEQPWQRECDAALRQIQVRFPFPKILVN